MPLEGRREDMETQQVPTIVTRATKDTIRYSMVTETITTDEKVMDEVFGKAKNFIDLCKLGLKF